jgi:hypothetical protein
MLWRPDGDDVAHIIDYRSLSDSIIARHDETVDALSEYVDYFGFSSSREGPCLRRGSCSTNRPTCMGKLDPVDVLPLTLLQLTFIRFSGF